MKYFCCTFCFAFLLLSFSYASCSFASEKVPLVTSEWPPFVSEHLPYFGFAAEIVAEAFEAADLSPAFHFYPWKRCEHMVNTGQAYAAFPYVRTDSRMLEFDFSDPIYKSRTVLFHLKSKFLNFNYSGPDSLSGRSVAGIHGGYYDALTQGSDVRLEYTHSVDAAFKMLFAGRVDFVVVNELVGKATANAFFPESTDQIGIVSMPFSEVDNHMIVSRTYDRAKSITVRFNEGLRIIRESGKYDEILLKHGMTP